MTFRVNKNYQKTLRKRKAEIEERIQPQNFSDQCEPVIQAGNIHYEISDRFNAVNYGGIGAIHLMVQKLGLAKEIDNNLHLLKVHLPYQESDHVLNIAYNSLLGGLRLEDIELRRQDINFLNALGAQRLPDPTTAGDFTRRFYQDDILRLQESINTTRKKVWRQQPKGFLKDAYIDVDGTIAEADGECKRDINMSYKGIWGYHPLILTLANTKEVLYTVNRPGNVPSHSSSAQWIDKACELLGGQAKRITLRGDTDFSSTAHLDRWDTNNVNFIFGMDARANLNNIAQQIEEDQWEPFERMPKYQIQTEPRGRRFRYKEYLVVQKGYTNIKLDGESLTEFMYKPSKCKRSYRVIVLRKNLTTKKGEQALFDEIVYHFYITNRSDLSPEQVVGLANGRCDQENVISQLKSGVNAMRMPVDDLMSNWAYMVMTSLAWNLKAWYGLLMPDRRRGMKLVRMEFRRFLNIIIMLPCQIIVTGRRIVYRLLGYNSWLEDFFRTFERIKGFS